MPWASLDDVNTVDLELGWGKAPSDVRIAEVLKNLSNCWDWPIINVSSLIPEPLQPTLGRSLEDDILCLQPSGGFSHHFFYFFPRKSIWDQGLLKAICSSPCKSTEQKKLFKAGSRPTFFFSPVPFCYLTEYIKEVLFFWVLKYYKVGSHESDLFHCGSLTFSSLTYLGFF